MEGFQEHQITRFKLDKHGHRTEVTTYKTRAEAAASIPKGCANHIGAAINGTRKTCGGFFWERISINVPDGAMQCFREHPVYKGYYANEEGHIWSNASKQLVVGWTLKSGYCFISVTKPKKVLKHRFVYECFNGLLADGMQVDHIDANPSNNVLSNLQALTVSEHAKKTHGGQSRPAHVNGKPITRFKLNSLGQRIEVMTYKTYAEAAASVSSGCVRHIRAVLKGTRKTSGGFFWEYVPMNDIDGESWCCPRNPLWRGIEVSNLGRIKSIHGIPKFGRKDVNGYFVTSVRKKGFKVHRIICETFHGPPPDKHHTSVDHIDNDPLNNKPENLRWATPKIQADNTHSKAVIAYNKDGSEAGRWGSAADAARELGGASTNISACLRGVTKTCRGLTWKYQ